MELVAIVLLMAVFACTIYALDRRYRHSFEAMSAEIRYIEGRADFAIRRSAKAVARVDKVEDFVVNRAIQSRYPGVKEMVFHVEEKGNRTFGYVNEVV